MRFGLTILLLSVVTAMGVGQSLRLTNIALDPMPLRPNLVPNFSFEEASPDGIPVGWHWDKRNTDATCYVDAKEARSGRFSIKFTNGTPFGAHVYGTLWIAQPIRLQPGKPYTLSVYVKSDDPGVAWIGGGHWWQFRLPLPPTKGQWQRVWMTFTPSEQDAEFVLRINTDSPTKGFWLDDVKLEEGNEPTPCEPVDKRWLLEPLSADFVVQGDGAFEVPFVLFAPQPLANATVAVSLGRVQLRRPISLAQGAWRLVVHGEAVSMDERPRMLSVQVRSGKTLLAQANASVVFFSSQNAQKRLDNLKQQMPSLQQLLDKVKAQGQDIAYPLVTYTVLQEFLHFVEDDLRHGEVRRALSQLKEMEAMAQRLRQQCQEALAGKRQFPSVPRWIGTVRPQIVGPSFIAPTSLSPTPRPVFFVGYGHFGQVRADIEKFPRYGVNIIQVEFGPNSIFPREGELSDAPIKETLQLLDRAAKAGVAVNLLISPHYFPSWMLEKYPHLRKRRSGFLQYCLHAPEGQELLRRYIEIIIPPLKDHPALHSICLTNEPTNEEEPCEYALQAWHEWLRKRHGTIDTLNQRWRTSFRTFEEIPLPNPFDSSLVPRPSPHWYDFIRFNQEWFAGWHKMLADAIKAIAPDLPVHAKAMTWTMLNDVDVLFGVDAELFGSFSDINGNDSINFYTYGKSEFAQGWQLNAMAFALQRSVKDAPVFNSENHIIPDRETRSVPPEHIRAALWQGAVYGQSATTIWVWERTFDPKSDFAGSIMHRPACAEAVGLTCHDLNRLAEEVTALQKVKPQAVLLHSVSALVWDGGLYYDCRNKLFTALSFTGLKLGFVTERQLEQGQLPNAALLFVPNIVHLSDAAFEALRRYQGRVVLVGDGALLSRNEYDEPRKMPDAPKNWERISFSSQRATWQELWQLLQTALPRWGVQPLVQIRDDKGSPVWGVEWLCAEVTGGLIVNLCNYRNEAVRITLWRNRKPVSGVDLLSGERVDGSVYLSPLQVRLLRISR